MFVMKKKGDPHIKLFNTGPSYPMGPGPGPPRLRRPPNSPCIIFYLAK